MQQNLQGLFERALDGEPVPPPGDAVGQAMAHGRRIRRRRRLVVGGSAATAVVAVVVALNVALAPTAAPPSTVSPAAALMAPPAAGCTWPVQDNATEVSIFLRDDVTLAQTAALRDTLWTDPAVREVRFESREQAYERFKRLWADSPDFVASVGVDSLPQSFRVRVADPRAYRQFAARVAGRTGVQDVVGQACPGTPK